jgi:orotate phosphoribosyltransferase
MRGEDLLSLFKSSGALLEGHFLLTSGMHSPTYFQCALLLQHPHLAQRLCRDLAQGFNDLGVEVVLSPAIGGIIVGYEVAKALGARSIFAERVEGRMRLRRGFEIRDREKAIVVEDVVTTGGSLQEVVGLVGEAGGKVVGVGALVDRSGGRADPALHSLVSLDVVTYPPEDCPLCQQGMPLVKPGSRANG